MTFLEAYRLAESFQGSKRLLRVCMSGVGEPMAVYLKAAGAALGVGIEPVFLPFNSLPQHLLQPSDGVDEVFLLLPWDLAPELDWRSGIPQSVDDVTLVERAQGMAEFLARRQSVAVYLPAPVPPVLRDAASVRALEARLASLAWSIGAVELAPSTFSMSAYLNTGVPVSGPALATVASVLIERALAARPEPAKVLVTDLDNVMWAGVAAEDGVDGIHFGPQGNGFRHFLYQTLLARLKSEGVILAAVTRNDPDVALAPFRSGRMVLKEDDFVAIVASYNAKSVQLALLAEQLNLGLDSFVFVDDNDIELTEVGLKLPSVRCERFPSKDDAIPAMLQRINEQFGRRTITVEDRDRTAMYRRRLAGMAPSDAQGADLDDFLRSLEMSLVIHDRSSGERGRAVQLINKTSQFNINGQRVTEDEVARILDGGGRLVTATLDDRNGTHGEILAILLDSDRVAHSFVMSCRVFNRRVETAFMRWLASNDAAPRSFRLVETARNLPARTFLAGGAFAPSADGGIGFDADRFLRDSADVEGLFRLVES